MTNTDTQLRDLVVKLEAKMEVMSDSMTTLANSVSKLADLKYEIVGIQKDIEQLKKEGTQLKDSVDTINNTLHLVEKNEVKTSFIIGKIDILWGALVTGAVQFIYWYLKK